MNIKQAPRGNLRREHHACQHLHHVNMKHATGNFGFATKFGLKPRTSDSQRKFGLRPLTSDSQRNFRLRPFTANP